MDFKVFLRRLTSLFLCFVLAACAPVLPVAHAAEPATATLAISAGATASGGIGGGAAALSVIAPQVAVVVGVALAASGIDAYVSSASAEQGLTKTQFVQQNLYRWCDAMGKSADYVLGGIANDIKVLENGTIQLGETAGKAISQFGSWLFTQEGLVVESVGAGSPAIPSWGDVDFCPLQNDGVYHYYNAIGVGPGSTSFQELGFSIRVDRAACAVCAVSDGLVFLTYNNSSISSISMQFIRNGVSAGSSSVTVSTSLGQYYYQAVALQWTGAISSSIPYYSNYTMSSLISHLRNQTLDWTDSQTNEDVFTGNADDWAENKDVFNPAIDEAISLNPDVIDKVLDAIIGASDYTMDISAYFDAITEAFDGVRDFAAEITDTVTGVKEQVTDIADALANPTIAISTPADGFPVFDPSEINMDGTISALQFDLTNIFPFCIPFDIAAAIDLLDATPQAPSYHVHWVLPGNVVFDFDVNLQQFDSTAALLRKMELLLFIVGLAVATRSLFIRG